MIITGAVGWGLIGPQEGLMYMIIGSILPDIDHPKSLAGKFNPGAYFMKHRGHAHSAIGCMIIALPFAVLSPLAYKFTLAGALCHLAEDSLSSFLKGYKFIPKIW